MKTVWAWGAVWLLLVTCAVWPAGAQVSGVFTDGSVQVGYDVRPCGPSIAGAVRYNSRADSAGFGVPSGGLLSYWPMDEEGGSTAYDRAGGHDLAVAAGAGFSSSGKVDGAASTPGVAHQRLEGPDVHDFAGTAPYTIALWVYFRSFPSTFNTIIGKVNGYPGNRNGWFVAASTVDGPGCGRFVSEAVSNRYDFGNPAAPYRWYHLACTYNGTHIGLFMDGASKGSVADNRNLADTAAHIAVGANASNSGAPNFGQGDQLTDDVRIYNRVLTLPEIKALYNCGLAGRCRGGGIEYCDGTGWRGYGF